MHYWAGSTMISKPSLGHPYLHLAELIKKGRREGGISRRRLAAIIGYVNLAKGTRRIEAFECGDRLDRALVSRMATALGIPQADVEMAWLADWWELLQRWNKWIDEPIPHCVVVEMKDANYLKIVIDRHVPMIRHVEHYATRVARRMGLPTWLIFSRRIASHFDRRGRLTGRVEAMPPSLGESFAELGGMTIPGWTSHFGAIESAPRAEHPRFIITNRFGQIFQSDP